LRKKRLKTLEIIVEAKLCQMKNKHIFKIVAAKKYKAKKKLRKSESVPKQYFVVLQISCIYNYFLTFKVTHYFCTAFDTILSSKAYRDIQ
jgi:hypothetical protein